jgi:hypothetical protein
LEKKEEGIKERKKMRNDRRRRRRYGKWQDFVGGVHGDLGKGMMMMMTFGHLTNYPQK